MTRRDRRRLARFANARTLLVVIAVGMVALSLGVGYAVSRVGAAATENCLRIHKLTHTLDKILAGSRRSLDAYVRDGTITPAQRDRGLAEIAMQRQELGGADCPPVAYNHRTGIVSRP